MVGMIHLKVLKLNQDFKESDRYPDKISKRMRAVHLSSFAKGKGNCPSDKLILPAQ